MVEDLGEFICADCHGTFQKTISDAEAFAADKQVFGDELTYENGVIICEDCYQKILKTNPHLLGE
jgi:DNA-directed RNA polymerase subunit RPC12/RpoP